MYELALAAVTLLGVLNVVNFGRARFGRRRLRPRECWLFVVMFIGYMFLNGVDGDGVGAALDVVGAVLWAGLALERRGART